ncbi:MAG: hypothetical protein KAX16_07675 [Actinomycetia bacterium]|nr:hypothetical protein [Actinomycetes bacterium]
MPYVPPIYPSTIPGTAELPNRTDDVDWLYAARYNELKKEMIAIMTELGTLPKAGYADITERLLDIEEGIASTKKVLFRCEAGENLAIGNVVYVYGISNGLLDVRKADNTDETKRKILGVSTQAKTTGQSVNIAIVGTVLNFNTSSWGAGDSLWVSTAGGFTNSVPTSGAIIPIGRVITSDASTGSIFVHCRTATNKGAASAQDLIIRMGDNIGAKKVIFQDYAGNQVAYIDSDGGTDLGAAAETGPDSQALDVKVNASNPTYQVDIDADYLQVQDKNHASINLTVAITSSGANGLDTGSEAANTWYSIWVIYNPGTEILASLLSISVDSPTLPSGYTKKRRVGWVRNNASSNFFTTMDLVEGPGFHDRGIPVGLDLAETDVTADDTWRDWDISAIIPPGAKTAAIFAKIKNNSVGATFGLRKDLTSGSPIASLIFTIIASEWAVSDIFCPCSSARKLEYYAANVGWEGIQISIKGWFF